VVESPAAKTNGTSGTKFEMFSKPINRARTIHVLALVTALLAILPLAIGASFWHTDSPGSEAACQICHVAHMPVLLGATVGVQAALKTMSWVNPSGTQVPYTAPAGLDSPPRAPPA
jgi:hypothetical protein